MGSHGDIGPELRRLAQLILDRLDPAVRAAAAAAAGARGATGRCQQVWCPVCALAALITGEQHPLLSVVADHSVALMTVISAMVADAQRAGAGDRPTPAPPTDPGAAPPAPGSRNGSGGAPGHLNSDATVNGRYQHIPIVVEPFPAEDDADV